MITNNIEARELKPGIIHGFVLDRSTKEPIMWVNVNIIGSDETSLTTDKGEFKVLSWKQTPITVRVEHESFEPVTLRVTCLHESLVIMLQRASRSNYSS